VYITRYYYYFFLTKQQGGFMKNDKEGVYEDTIRCALSAYATWDVV